MIRKLLLFARVDLNEYTNLIRQQKSKANEEEKKKSKAKSFMFR
jgi:hypothetical protein